MRELGAPSAAEPATRDFLDPWGLTILQPRDGFRFGLPAILLAAFVELEPGDTAVELGAGSGIVSLILARRFPLARLLLAVEMEGSAARLAAANARQCASVRVVRAEYGSLALTRPVDVVFGNPPHHRLGGRQVPVLASRALATCEVATTLASTVGAAARLLGEKGRCAFVYPAAREDELRAHMSAAGLPPARIQRVIPVEGRRPNLVLVSGARAAHDAREETLTVLDASGRYTDAAARAYGFPSAAAMTLGGWRTRPATDATC